MMFIVFMISLVVGISLEPMSKESVQNASIRMLEEQDDEIKTVADIITQSDGDVSDVLADSFLELGSVQEIQTIKDYLEQLKVDIRTGASSYVQDSVAMMEELTTAIKDLKKKIEVTVDRVNSKAESKLLAIKAIEELIGFSSSRAITTLVQNNVDVSEAVENSLLETGSIQEIQTIKDYLEQLKADIRTGASSYVQDSVSMMEELTTAIKNLKRKIEVTVDRVNVKAESKLLAIKAIEELIGFSAKNFNLVEQSPVETSVIEGTSEINSSAVDKPKKPILEEKF